jgi:hypothetical protein
VSKLEALEATYRAAVEAHKSHPPRLRRDRDGIYHCAACNPGTWWERAVETARGWRHR